jgi:hypothetical protein
VARGGVLDGFRVRASKDVAIGGLVGSATVEAGGDILIRGGVNGRGKAHLAAGGRLEARYLHGARVEAGGDVTVQVECIDSLVQAGGRVHVQKGGIIGGRAGAAGDLQAGFLGSEMCVDTRIAAGSDDALVRKSQGLRQRLIAAREALSNLERAAGRGHAAAAAVAEARKHVDELVAALVALAPPSAPPGAKVVVQRTVHPNVEIVIDSVCTLHSTTEIAGPVTLVAERGTASVRPAGA